MLQVIRPFLALNILIRNLQLVCIGALLIQKAAAICSWVLLKPKSYAVGNVDGNTDQKASQMELLRCPRDDERFTDGQFKFKPVVILSQQDYQQLP